MTPPDSTTAAPGCTDPFRWDEQTRALSFDLFRDPAQATSQRQFAKDQGIPRSTLGSWLRRPDPEGLDPDLVAFFRSRAGLAFLRRLVLALFVVFVFGGACGLRLLALFLRRTQLDRFVAPSLGALHDLGAAIERD